MSSSEPQQAPNARIIAKLQKILALANTPIPPDASDALRASMEAEATHAAQMAQELMAAYNLSMAELGATGGTQEGDKRTTDKYERSAMFTYWRKLWEACAVVNYCWYEAIKIQEWKRGHDGNYKYHYKTHHHQFIGREVNVAATKVLGEYLEETVNRLCPYKPGRSSSKSQVSWKEGCVQRLVERLHEQKREIERRDAQQREAAAASNTGTAITLRSVAKFEEDENYAHKYGREALLRMQSYRHAEGCDCRFCEQRRESLVRYEQQRAASVATEKPETPAQKRKRQEREQRQSDKYWEQQARKQERERNKYDQDALKQGRQAAENISLNKQVGGGNSTKTLGE